MITLKTSPCTCLLVYMVEKHSGIICNLRKASQLPLVCLDALCGVVALLVGHCAWMLLTVEDKPLWAGTSLQGAVFLLKVLAPCRTLCCRLPASPPLCLGQAVQMYTSMHKALETLPAYQSFD